MKFGELKSVINRNAGRHDRITIHIGLGFDAVIDTKSELLDYLDEYTVNWIAPSTIGKNTVTEESEPCIEIHLMRKE